MTESQFADAVRLLCQEFGGSVTSWGRTDAHSKSVGGFAGDPHTHWYGADVVWDEQPSGFALQIRQAAYTVGLWVIWEGNHTHFQPRTYPAGPLTTAQVQAWQGQETV